VIDLRERQKRNFLATLLLSQGIPMILGGDEVGRTQRGNNNAYCQDTELSWYDWGGGRENWPLLEFVRSLTALRRAEPVFRRRRWFQGRSLRGTEVGDVAWLTPAGEEMSDDDWETGYARSLGVFLNGDAILTLGTRGERISGDSFLLCFNAHSETVTFRLPAGHFGQAWRIEVDTSRPVLALDQPALKAGEEIAVEGRCVVVLRRVY